LITIFSFCASIFDHSPVLHSFPTRRSSDLQAGADVGDEILWLQTVGAQGVAGVDHVDDLVGQADQRCQLHRAVELDDIDLAALLDRKSTRLNSSHVKISYAVFRLE